MKIGFQHQKLNEFNINIIIISGKFMICIRFHMYLSIYYDGEGLYLKKLLIMNLSF